MADNQVNLLAATNTTSESSSNSSKSGSVGIGIQLGSGGPRIGLTVSVAKATGEGAGNSTTYSNSHVGGSQVHIESGGDTTLAGAVVKGEQIAVETGGDLRIASLQDSKHFDSRQESLSGSLTIGPAAGGSLGYGSSRINSDYASVTEQSGLRAGDGGFQIEVGGTTTLTGGVISSTQAAVDDGRNRFTSAQLESSDLTNRADYKGESVGISLGMGQNASSSAGVGQDSGSASSTTQSGISGIAGNKDARTGDAESGIGQIFDAERVQNEINAQVEITQTFGREASKEVGDYADRQMVRANGLKAAAKLENDPAKKAALENAAQAIEQNWGDNGILRLGAHAVVGGLTGGSSGALGAAAGTLTGPAVAKALKEADIKGALADTLTGLVATAAAGAVGGTAGAAAGLNEVSNNYLKHEEQRKFAEELSKCKDADCINNAYRTYQGLSDSNNLALLEAQAQCHQTGQCKSYEQMLSEGTGWGGGARKTDYQSDHFFDGEGINKENQAANDAIATGLINKKLKDEVAYVPAYSYTDEFGDTHSEGGYYVSAIDAQNNDKFVAVTIGGATLFAPGVEELAVGAVLLTKTGQKLAQVVLEGGKKFYKPLVDAVPTPAGGNPGKGAVTAGNADASGGGNIAGSGGVPNSGITRVGDGPLPTGRQTLDPTEISFSQATVSGRTSDGMTHSELVTSMRRDGWQGDAVDVVNMPDGAPTCMDNRRLLAAREAGIPIEANVRNAGDPLLPGEVERFSVTGQPAPTTWGEAIQLRTQRQGTMQGVDPSWSERFPNGSIYDPDTTRR